MKQQFNPQCRQLPLSHLSYHDDAIDPLKANQLLVYHYPLHGGYSWKERAAWQQQIDQGLDSRQYAYLIKQQGQQLGLFVALSTADQRLPDIVNADGISIVPERVEYAAIYNPIWIRLIMRSILLSQADCKGAHHLGQPLLKIDHWSQGIDAIRLDCKTQQLRDGYHTEIALFYSHVALRPIRTDQDPTSLRQALWMYDKNNVLLRYYPRRDHHVTGVIYSEVKKQKHSRKQRAFLDLRSAQTFARSRPMIIKPIQEAFIRLAAVYGFELSAKILTLQKYSTKTKSKSAKTQSTFSSIHMTGEIKVLDLRVNTRIKIDQILDLFQQLLQQKSISITWDCLHGDVLDLGIDGHSPQPQQLALQASDRVLVLLDQVKGIEDDRYPLSKALAQHCAVQHINLNPYSMRLDPVEAGYLSESLDEDDPILFYTNPDKPYYGYLFEHMNTQDYRDGLAMKLDVVLKELELKRLLLDSSQRISQLLPLQQHCLHPSIIVITDGYFFTVAQDRPVLIPFDPSHPELCERMNLYLQAFSSCVADLIALILAQWPYAYRPQPRSQRARHGTTDESIALFPSLTLVISRGAGDSAPSIMLQDPKLEHSMMLPLGMEQAYADLCKKQQAIPLVEWRLPAVEILQDMLRSLTEEGVFSIRQGQRLGNELAELQQLWQLHLQQLEYTHQFQCFYMQIKRLTFHDWLTQRDKLKDAALMGSWDTLMSHYFNKPLNDVKRWMNMIPGVRDIWVDSAQGYLVVGGLMPPKQQLMRQPSIRRWHALQGELNIELLVDLLDVDWVRMNQLAGNPCVATLIKRWKEINNMQACCLSV